MRIGIDIDGVLTNLEQFHKDYGSKYCVENNIKFHIDAIRYDISQTFNIRKEDAQNFWDEYLDFYVKEIEIRPLASEVIKRLDNSML